MTFSEGYLDMLLSSYLSSILMESTTTDDKMAIIATFVLAAICLLIMPTIIIYVANKPLEVLTTKSFKRKFGKVFEDLKVRQQPAMFYSMIYLLRRVLFICIIFSRFLINHVSLQILALTYLQGASIMYLYKYLPYYNKLQLYLELSNELTVLTVTEYMILFTDILNPV